MRVKLLIFYINYVVLIDVFIVNFEYVKPKKDIFIAAFELIYWESYLLGNLFTMNLLTTYSYMTKVNIKNYEMM